MLTFSIFFPVAPESIHITKYLRPISTIGEPTAMLFSAPISC